MPTQDEEFLFQMRPTAARPLLGQTVLAVEDSRFAGEALRLMCLRSGARFRRADSLAAAGRHLANYRPTTVIVDLGLPDGCGGELIRTLARTHPRVPVLLAVSGDPAQRETALDAGADAFLEKPLGTLAAFQSAILDRLPLKDQPRGPRLASDETVAPEPEALRDDLSHVAELLSARDGDDMLRYAAGFALGLGRSAGDAAMVQAATGTLSALRDGTPTEAPVAALAAILDERTGARSVAS